MKKTIAAIALAIALPAAAAATQAPNAPAKPACCAGMKEMCACCKGITGAGHKVGGTDSGANHASDHAGHHADHYDSKAAPSDPHPDYQR